MIVVLFGIYLPISKTPINRRTIRKATKPTVIEVFEELFDDSKKDQNAALKILVQAVPKTILLEFG
jgi:1,4-dihydroxy-2-naphthoyl-CoA synthase